jgi:hypothetical protein
MCGFRCFSRTYTLYYTLPNLKNQMTRHLWIRGVTEKTSQSEVQYQPITQGFRVVGSNSKLGKDRKVRAFKLNDRFNSDYWNEWIERQAQAFRNKDLVPIDLKYTSKLSLEKAKEKYPEWYQKRIVQGEAKEHYIVKRALYDWYKRELIEKERSVEGRRYYRVMCLAIYAKKCGISKEELEQDALRLYERINSEEHNHIFELDDMYAALEMYNDNYYTFPRKSIAALTGYEIKANKRNYRKQEDHIRYMNIFRDFKYEGRDWREGNGRKSKKEEVLELYNAGVKKEKDIAVKLNIRIETVKRHLREEGLYKVKKKGGQSKEKIVKELIKKYPNESLNKLSKISGIDPKTIKKYNSK